MSKPLAESVDFYYEITNVPPRSGAEPRSDTLYVVVHSDEGNQAAVRDEAELVKKVVEDELREIGEEVEVEGPYLGLGLADYTCFFVRIDGVRDLTTTAEALYERLSSDLGGEAIELRLESRLTMKVEEGKGKYFELLDNLMDSGVAKIFGTIPFLIEVFDLSEEEARKVLIEWARSFLRRRSWRFSGRGRGRFGGNKAGAGPGGVCVCPECGKRIPHETGVPCYRVRCPECGTKMLREGYSRKYVVLKRAATVEDVIEEVKSIGLNLKKVTMVPPGVLPLDKEFSSLPSGVDLEDYIGWWFEDYDPERRVARVVTEDEIPMDAVEKEVEPIFVLVHNHVWGESARGYVSRDGKTAYIPYDVWESLF